MIITEAHGNIHKRWRDEEGFRRSSLDEDFKSYFYIDRGEAMPDYFDFRRKGNNVRIRPTYDLECEEVNINGESLVKVIVDEPNHVYDLRGKWDKTYEADVSMVRKYCKGDVTFPEYSYRKWYLDIETQVSGRYDGHINAITVYDNYDDIYYVMSWIPTEPMPEIDMCLSPGNTELKMYEDEEDMSISARLVAQEARNRSALAAALMETANLVQESENLIIQAREELFNKHFNKILDLASQNINQRKEAELQSLRDTEEFRNASAEKRADMEKDALKRFKDQEKIVFRLNQAVEIAKVFMSAKSAEAQIVAVMAQIQAQAA